MYADVSRGLIAVAMVLVASGVACDSTSAPGDSIASPSELSAEAVGTTTVRISWKPAEGSDVAGYEIERRVDLQGDFQVVEGSVPPNSGARIAWLDTHVEPDRYYGYRVRAVSRLGGKSGVSNIAGTKTASMPGLLIQTSTQFPNPESADPDGYTAVVRGTRDTQSVAVGITGERLVHVARGSYTVALRGLSNNCATATASDSVKSATVSDEGTHTVSGVSFVVSCRDPKKASIVVAHQTLGDTLDADGLALTISGIILEPGTPADERVYFQTRTLEGASGATRFDNLRLGDYEITVADVDAPCVLNSNQKQTLQPKALAVDTVRVALTCRKPVVIDTVGKPFIFRNRWSVVSARPGDKVSLLTSLDLRAQASQQVAGASATIAFDNSVIRYDSARTTGVFDLTTVSRPQPTVLAIVATNTDGQGETGDVQIVRTWFTVVGAVGSSVRTSTTLSDILTPQLALLNSKVRVDDATLTISNTGSPTNQAPTASITGPTTGTAGTALSFSGAQSRDADGSILGYAWSFGDNSTGSGVAVTHTYSSAGSYTVRLTVTDDGTATASVDQTVVVSAVSSTTGTIAGTVTSGQTPLAGVTINVTGGGTATTSATGSYSIANVATGSRTISVGAVPSTCTAPSSQTVTVTAGATATVNFAVQCTATSQAGTITGKITRASDGTGIAGIQVLVQPTGGTALAGVTTGTDGSYTVNNVPIGTGTSAGAGSISLSGLPATCANPGSQSYTALAAGGSVTKNVTVTCGASGPHTYPFNAAWGPITNTGPTGRQVTLSFSIDMGTAPGRVDIDSLNADPLAGISFSISYNGTLLDYTSRVLLPPGGEFDLAIVSESGANTAGAQANVAIASTSGQTLTGSIQLIRLTFNIATGMSGSVTPTVVIIEALATNSLIDVKSSVVIPTLPTLTVP